MRFIRHKRMVVVAKKSSLSAVTPTIPARGISRIRWWPHETLRRHKSWWQYRTAILIDHGLRCGGPHLVVIDPHRDHLTWLVHKVIRPIHHELELPSLWEK